MKVLGYGTLLTIIYYVVFLTMRWLAPATKKEPISSLFDIASSFCGYIVVFITMKLIFYNIDKFMFRSLVFAIVGEVIVVLREKLDYEPMESVYFVYPFIIIVALLSML